MLANLIDNAIRYNSPNGYVRVRTATVTQGVELVVSNGGAVIEPEQVRTLTEPFRRLSRKPGGFGLGLSIVRSVAAAHRGSLNVVAPITGGLVVTVSLPAGTGCSRRFNQQPSSARVPHALTRTCIHGTDIDNSYGFPCVS